MWCVLRPTDKTQPPPFYYGGFLILHTGDINAIIGLLQERGCPMNQVIQQLKDRKSVRVFTDRPITAEEEAAILQAQVQF